MGKVIGRKQASIYNMISMGAYQLTTALFGFILPNLILRTYGANLHGYTSTVTNIMAYIALVNAGLAPAAVQALYAPLVRKDEKRICEILQAIDRFYIISGCLYTVAVVGTAYIMPLVIGEQLPGAIATALMIVIGASNTMECFVYSKYKVLLQADQKLYVVSMVDQVFYLIRIVSQIALIRVGASIVWVMLVPAIMVIGRMGALAVFCRKNYHFSVKGVKPDYRSLSNRWSAMIHQIAGLVVFNTDVTLLTIFGTLAEVSIYSVYNLIFNQLYHFLTNIFSSGTLASFGQLLSENKRDRLLKAYDIYEFGYFLVIAFVYGVSGAMILPFVSVYTIHVTDVVYARPMVAILFLIIGIANNIRIPCLSMINAAGHFKNTQNHAMLEALINITVSLLLLKPLGMYGLLIGTICSFAYRTTIIIIYAQKNILKISCKTTLKRLTYLIVILGISNLIYYFLIGKYKLSTWTQWIGYAVLASAITGTVILTVVLIVDGRMLKDCLSMVLHSNNKDRNG